ncbi:MAG: ABC transporter ATP-binding protein [Spirochaetales bacterium]|nr:ABC transporter ATP-binding protein [Spirochaetales bacterium]
MVGLESLVKSYGSRNAVDGLSFILEPGEITGFLGPNGAGKTTTINMMAGMLRPTSGRITCHGRPIHEDMTWWKRHCGVVPENPLLFHALTLGEHLMLAGRLHSISERETEQRCGSLFEYLGLSGYRETVSGKASRGMKKKCALAMALIHKPRVLICDELFNGIDPVSSHNIRLLFETLAEKGTIIFFSSHTLPIVETLSDRIIIIDRGAIAADIRAVALKEGPENLESLFFNTIGNPPTDLSGVSWLI